MKSQNIAVAGAGPGGLAAAFALHRLGHKVVVYEQFETPKPLGSGLILQPTGLGVLDWLGLGQRMRKLGARIDRLHGTSSSTGRVVLDVRYDAIGPERGYAVHRAALFNVLYDAVKVAGIAIETRKLIKGFDDGLLQLGEGRTTPRFDLVVDALGARSPLKRLTPGPHREKALTYGAVWASLPWPGAPFDQQALSQRYRKASVMIGVLPIGRITEAGETQAAFFWSLKVNDYALWTSRGIAAWKQEVIQHWPETARMLEHINSADDLTLARYQHHTLVQPCANKLVCIGDSAHAASPQLGQGANMALLDVRALVDALSATQDVQAAIATYAQVRKRHVRTYQLMSHLFTPFYQSDSAVLPIIRDYLVPPLARLPLAQKLLAHMVAGTLVQPADSQSW